MFKRILVAYDGSDSSRSAFDAAIGLAQRLGTELQSISVEEHLPRYAATISEVEGAKERIDEHFRALTKEARDRAALEGVDLETAVRRGHEVEEILDFARSERCDLLVLGSHGDSGILRRIIGSTALSLVRNAPCSVLIIRAGRRAGGFDRILVGVDGSPLGRLAFHTALDFAILYGARVTGVTVREVSPLARPEALDAAYVEQLRAAAEEQARSAGVAFEHLSRLGHAAQVLRDLARDAGADVIALGATGLEHPWSATIGGTATSVASEARCSILLVRSPRSVLHARDVMVRAVSAASEATSLAEVVELLLRRNVKALPVLDGQRRVVGIVTGGDLLSRGGLDLRLSVKQDLETGTVRQRLRDLASSHKTARDVMTRHVRTIDAEADLATVIRLMVDHHVKRLPVVDHEKRFVGIVSRADVLRAIAALPQPPEPTEHELPAVARTVADATTTEVPVVRPETGAETVLERIVESPQRRVVVVDAAGTVIGLVSDRDLLARSSPDTRPWLVRVLRGQPASTRAARGETQAAGFHPLTAADLMAPSLITVRPQDSLVDAVRLMMQHRVKRLIVVDADGRFRGLVDRREILRVLAGVTGP